jgi:3-deoxy-7-phosphoheptulonate synthase
MTLPKTLDVRISNIHDVPNAQTICGEYPISDAAAQLIQSTRDNVHRVLQGQDDRLLVVIGPCSIHDIDCARDYADRLLALRRQYEKDLIVIMRVYFEKPRTTVGWKGLINDPDLDGTFRIEKGLRLARELLLDLNEKQMPVGTEYLDLLTPQYTADLVSWGAIGARTTESQLHRELASGLSCPVGFKNGTDGNLKIAVDAISAAKNSHHFLSLTQAGQSAIFTTTGNSDCHLILRGGKKPNFDRAHVESATDLLQHSGLIPRVMIDFSHANSLKDHQRQMLVAEDVSHQISEGDDRIIGVMVESHIESGRQDIVPGQALVYGRSVTDACIGWDDSVTVIDQLAQAVRARRANRHADGGSD